MKISILPSSSSRYSLYNVIAKIETVAQDTKFIQQLMKAEAIGEFPHAYKNTEMDYQNYERNLKLIYDKISKRVMNRVCERWKWDFLLFDYDITPFCPEEFWS